jgi:alanine racemase
VPGSTARVDPGAIAHNVRQMAAIAAPATVCAVVKAGGYGHGAVTTARAALDAGAGWLAVARVDEVTELRAAGIEAPVLLLSEPSPEEVDAALAARARLVVFRREAIDAVSARATDLRLPAVELHLKVDTGMRRVGCRPEDAVPLAARIEESPGVRLEGTMTHLARADEPDDPTTDRQVDTFETTLADLESAGIPPGIVHAANSAGTMAFPRSRLDLVRVGIAIYGIPPAPGLARLVDLRPAMAWTSTVSMVKSVRAGDAVSYGHRYRFGKDSVVATVPVGYADGLRRRYGLAGGQVLIGGRRCPVVGVVTMDQAVVDCGPSSDVAVGDEVVLLGRQGAEEITADEVAGRLDTIGYEVVCGISARVPRTVL